MIVWGVLLLLPGSHCNSGAHCPRASQADSHPPVSVQVPHSALRPHQKGTYTPPTVFFRPPTGCVRFIGRATAVQVVFGHLERSLSYIGSTVDLASRDACLQ